MNAPALMQRLDAWARCLKTQLILLWLCYRQADMPWQAKVIALITVAYAVSPIDLIPDFIPVLGYLDDAILLPLGIALALRLIPVALQQRCRPQAEAMAGQRIVFKGRLWMAAGIVMSWLGLAWAVWRWASGI
jgi:uncharacterized membrane protein YkvA (DUF1232 family)